MKAVIQRVSRAAVRVDGETVGEIGRGLLLLLGIAAGDTPEMAEKLTEKIARLRIFPDENGKTNLSAADTGGGLLVVSQFTLLADCRKGNRPSFIGAGEPAAAEALYRHFIEASKPLYAQVAAGVFGAMMEVELVNDGPFTLVLEL
jgi:D-tyrosyl-tRNA(Tyr) deacylase